MPVGRKGNLLAVCPRRSRPGEKHEQAAGDEKKTLHAGSSKIAIRRMLFKRPAIYFICLTKVNHEIELM